MRNMPKVLAIFMILCGACACHATLDCGEMTEVALNESYIGDNTGLPDNVSLYGCSDWEETGGEVVHHLYLAAPSNFEVRIESVCDLDLAILSGCNEIMDCIEVTDDGAETASPQQGDFYFVVDGYEGASCAFELFVDDRGVANEMLSFGEIKTRYGN